MDAMQIGSTWRLRLLAAGASADALLVVPELAAVIVREQSADALAGDPDTLSVMHLPGGDASPVEAVERALAWVGPRPGPRPIDLLLHSERVLWTPGRAVVIGSTVNLDAYLRGLGCFGFLEASLTALEHQIAAAWPAAERDAELTHGIDAASLRRWPEVNQATRLVTRGRLRLAAIAGPLGHAPATLDSLGARLFTELAAQTEIAHRLDQAETRVEALVELYQAANDRLSAYSYFRREYRVEWLIVAVLLAELVMMLLLD
jgi:hypothetical protein